jgi:uncharacterized protein (DUF1330 family)
MSIYMILEAEIHDVDAYEKYKEAAPQFVARYGGEYCCRGGAIDVLIGEWLPRRVVMLKFPSRAKFDALMADPDYRPWKELRESLTTIKTQVLLEGV